MDAAAYKPVPGLIAAKGNRHPGLRLPPASSADESGRAAHWVLSLQASGGNRAVARLLTGPDLSGRVPAGAAPSVQRDDAPEAGQTATGGAALTLSRSSWLGHEPGEFLDRHHTLPDPSILKLAPGSFVDPLIDWGGVGATFRNRQLTLGDSDRGLIVQHWQRWYPVAQLLYGLPLAKKFFTGPADVMNTLTQKMVDASLAGDHPNPVELFNLESERFGVTTHTVSVPVWKF